MSFFLVTRLLNARTCLFRTDSKQSLRPLSFLSRTGNVLHAFHLQSFCILAFFKREHSASLLQSTKIAPSRESVRILADLWAFAHTDLRIQEGFAQTANIVCGSLICLFSSSLAYSILASVFSAPSQAEGLRPLFFYLSFYRLSILFCIFWAGSRGCCRGNCLPDDVPGGSGAPVHWGHIE